MEAVLEKSVKKKKSKLKLHTGEQKESSASNKYVHEENLEETSNLDVCFEVEDELETIENEQSEDPKEKCFQVQTITDKNEQKQECKVEHKVIQDVERTSEITSLKALEDSEIKNEYAKLLTINKGLINDLKIKEIEQNRVTALEQTKPKEIDGLFTIKPYSESQLSSLYHNGELDMLENFNTQFVEAELRGLVVKQHPLYDLLINYLRVRERITGNALELDQIRKEYKKLQNDLWTIETATVNGRGQCQDGTIVTASHNYSRSIFHRSVFQNIVRILGNVQKLTYENHILYSYSAEELRLHIELYIQTVINNCLNVTNLDKNAPVSLTLQSEPPYLKPYLLEIRLCISVLFAFQRKLIRETNFVKETKQWLTNLIAVLLRLANFQDHLFILNHILRCQAGVGVWASSFVQCPLATNLTESPFANYQINHLLTILDAILTPIKEREKFLEDVAHSKEMVTEALWVMVDSDGEDDDESSGTSLRENDLVALLNQLPLDDLFRNVILINTKDYKDFYNESAITEHHILRYLSFATVLLKILHKGMQTYNAPRYKQFSKRLSRFVRHIVQYATDQWEQFSKFQHLEDKAMLNRLQVEYDSFFLRAIYSLYSSQKLGAWQFLAVVPYNMVSIKTLWKIFYFLHTSDSQAEDILNPLRTENFDEKLWGEELRTEFEEKLGDLEDAEVYYLLNTFANMALAREDSEMDFIYAAVVDLLKVGFISKTTQESCSKSSRILLTHLTSKHPHLLSNILKEVKNNIEKIGELAFYLYGELPLTIWKLSDIDLELISKLLLNNPLTSNDNKLARMILSRLNWDELPYEMHCDVAILVVHAMDQDPGLMQWAWQTILRLKLHISDKAFKEIGRVREVECYDILMKGIREQKPLASFVTILMTTWGHLVPLICTKGLNQLIFLQSQQNHEAVLFALYLIVPLFVNCQECLINCDKYQEVLLNLLNADRGYISMAKSLVYAQNTVLQQFGNMIETQIVNFAFYDLESPRCLVRLWINSLVSIPSWNRDMAVIYLLDVIVRTAFFHKDAFEVVYTVLRDLLQCGTPQEQTGTISSLFKWVSNANTSNSFLPNSLSSYTWLAYIVISLEHEEKERHTGLWFEILNQLNRQKGKVNVDQAIKKAASITKVPPLTSALLCLYRWAQQALETPVNHPLLPLIWQKFFTLYLSRIPVTNAADRSCVGDKFFDGLVNFAFLKKIKRYLQESVEYFQEKLNECDENDEKNRKSFYQSSLGIFRAFLLWLEEPRLQENNVLLKNLPPQYNSVLLTFILQGDDAPWYQFLDYDSLKDNQQKCIRTWRIANFREKTNVNRPLLNPGSSVESSDPVERILRRLTSYDKPKPPPSVVISAPLVPKVDFSNKEEMFRSLDQTFKILKQFAHNHALKLSEQKALDCSYQELIPQLYRSVLNKVKKKVPCKGRDQTVNCSGAATLVLEMQEARINERIEHQVQTNRNAYESILAICLQSPSLNLCTASVSLQHTIKILQSQLRCNPATAELGVELFYYLLSLINEETNNYLPTKTLFSSCLEKLGQSHICGVEYEMPRLLQKILKEPQLGGHLAPHFLPSSVGTLNLLIMYSTVCKEIGQKYDITFALLSKFEVENWLQDKRPKLSERSQFIQLIVKALTTLGFDTPVEASMLHGLYRKHLLTVFEFQFPEHYGEVLILLLKASNGNPETSLLSISVWLDILNSLARPVSLNLKQPLRDQLRQYAQHQKMLNHQVLLETAELLSRHFTQERLQYGLYGLYPKCRNYMDVFVILLGMTGHGIIVSMLNTHQGLLGDKLCEKIWPYLKDMFAPWIVPYSMQNLKDNMAAWIQQLADDRSVLLPWIPADGNFALKVINVFVECITFIMHTLPASNIILSYIWQWYVTCYAHVSIKDHILMPIHQSFISFPWHKFWPSSVDLEFMLRVIDQYLPECHSFLGHIFMTIPWSDWLTNFSNAPPQIKNRTYHCFLNLVVKLCNEPNVRKNHNERAKSLLIQAETFDWVIIEPSVFQHVMDWFVQSCDPYVVFKAEPLDLDYRLFHFLKIVANYNNQIDNSDSKTLNKRLIYVKTCVKLFSVYGNRNKINLGHKEQEITVTISRQLKDLEYLSNSEEESTVLLKELLCILNIEKINLFALGTFLKWIENKDGDSLVVRSLIKTLGMAVTDYEILSELYEATLNSYFCNAASEVFQATWREVGELFTISSSKHTELEQTMLTKGCLLALNAILIQKISKCNDLEPLLNLCLDWMVNIKINDKSEKKIPLIWCNFIRLAKEYAEKDEASCGAILNKFSQILLQISTDKSGTGWGRGLLSAIGLAKQGISTLNFKFLCRALAGYILAQLPEMRGEPQVVRKTSNAPSKVGQPGGNTECVKILLTLDFGQSQGKIKDCAELALKQIQDPNNSLHNTGKFILLLVKQFYSKPYFKDIG